MDLFAEDLYKFAQKATEGLSLRIDQARNKTNDELDELLSQAKEDDFLPAVEDILNSDIFNKLRQIDNDSDEYIDILSDNNVLAPCFRIGTVAIPYLDRGGEIKQPLIIPMQDIHAYMFTFGTKSNTVPTIMQNILLRMLLSTRPELLKISIVDMDFGNNFPLVQNIQKIKSTYIAPHIHKSTEEVSKLVDSLADELGENSMKMAGRYTNIYEYNINNIADPLFYHIVLIDDFPKGFTSQSFEKLCQLINNGNAARAGIRIFINYCGSNNSHTYGLNNFNIELLGKECHKLILDDNGALTFSDNNGGEYACGTFQADLFPQNALTPFMRILKSHTPPERIYSLDGWVQDLIANDKIWSGSTIDGIKVPIGYNIDNEYYNFYIANGNDIKCNDFFTLIAGNPNMGKSTLLRNIVTNAALKYSPEELNYYLLDFGNGTSLGIFRNLPHARALMLANSKDYAIRILDDIENTIVKKRADDFQRAATEYGTEVDNFTQYRTVTGKTVPYILLVMDEFHVLFQADDKLAEPAKIRLCNGIRQWRKYGIGAILCTQSITGVNFGDANDYITYRFALQLTQDNSERTIRNKAAASLTQKGQTIVNNTPNGDVNANIQFRAAYSKNYISYVKLLAERYGKPITPFICDNGAKTDMAANETLKKMLTSKIEENINECDIYIGYPDLLRIGHSRIQLQRREGSNILLYGDDFNSLVRIQSAAMMQIEAQSPQGSSIYIVNAFNANDEYYAAFDNLPDTNGFVHVFHAPQIEEAVNAVWNELQKRKQLLTQEGQTFEKQRMILSLLNVQNCVSLRSTGSLIRPDSSPTAKKIAEIIKDGPALGIHVIMHALTANAVFGSNNLFAYDLKEQFSNVILMTNAGIGYGDSIGKVRFIYENNQKGRIFMINNCIDGEPHEQCAVYSKCTFEPSSVLGKHLIVNYFIEKTYSPPPPKKKS